MVDVPAPSPGSGELSIDVDFAGVGLVDTLFVLVSSDWLCRSSPASRSRDEFVNSVQAWTVSGSDSRLPPCSTTLVAVPALAGMPRSRWLARGW